MSLIGSAVATFGGTGTALLGGSLIGALASNSAADSQANAANRAADLQQNATDFQKQQLLKTEANLQPYMQAAQPALGALQAGTYPGGQFNNPITASDINANIAPDYGFVQQQGEKGIRRQEAAQGLYGSGAASKAMDQYDVGLASGYANQAFQNYQNDLLARFNRLQTVAGMGQNAAAGQGGLTNQAAGNITNSSAQTGANIIGGANATAAGIVGGANAVSQPLNTVGTLGLMSQYGISPTSTGAGGEMGGVNQSAGSGTGVSYGIGGQSAGIA